MIVAMSFLGRSVVEHTHLRFGPFDHWEWLDIEDQIYRVITNWGCDVKTCRYAADGNEYLDVSISEKCLPALRIVASTNYEWRYIGVIPRTD
jgi:hypothetical protein